MTRSKKKPPKGGLLKRTIKNDSATVSMIVRPGSYAQPASHPFGEFFRQVRFLNPPFGGLHSFPTVDRIELKAGKIMEAIMNRSRAKKWDPPKKWFDQIFGREPGLPALSRIETFLKERKIPYEVLSHPETYKALDLPESLRAPSRQVAKVVIVRAKHHYFMMVLPSHLRLDPRRVARILWTDQASLATEEELKALFPDCEIGAMPPFGEIYGLPVYVDVSLIQEPVLYFPAGTHHHVIKMHFQDFKHWVNPKIGVLSDASTAQRLAS
jgi:Ala-tRNA(Pro) deacylase